MSTLFIFRPDIKFDSDLLTTSTSGNSAVTICKMTNINQSKIKKATKVFNEVFNKYDVMNDIMSFAHIVCGKN